MAAELTAIATMAAKAVPILGGFLLEGHNLRAGLEKNIEHLQNECKFYAAAIGGDGKLPHSSAAASEYKVWIGIVRELAYDIDACVDTYAQLMSTAPVLDAWWIRRKAHQLKTVRARGKFAKAIIRLKEQSDRASIQRMIYTKHAYGEGSVALSEYQVREAREKAEAEAKAEADTTLSGDDLPVPAVGMKAAHDELEKLIMENPQGQRPNEKLKVISVVGFGGIGKTLLARHAYHSAAVVDQYPARAWVHAATKGPEDVLEDILLQLGTINGGDAGQYIIQKLRATLHKRLGTERFFIVIDDMRADFWVDIQDAFPVDSGVNSRVIITTATHSIANKCSSRNGHVCVMRTLTRPHPEKLFLASMMTVPDAELSSEVIIRKCDGLPLALVTTARSLDGETRPGTWAEAGEKLGSHLETLGGTNTRSAMMQRVLVRSYTSLSKEDIKTCLLYLGIYPSDRPIKRGSMIRRWSAEGFTRAADESTALQAAVNNFNVLVDRSIIQPMDGSGSSTAVAKTCQTHGIILEFIVHKSRCENFVTVLYGNGSLQSDVKVRWLSLNNASASRSKINPRHLRSLTIFGKTHKSVLHFSKYKVMRVLDLEGCANRLDDKHLKDICSNLLLLRYLSLRGVATVTVLPKQIKKLKYLETLDVKGTKIDILPKHVIKLPCLVYLFGKVKLQEGTNDKKIAKLKTWLSQNSKLETVAGFVVDNDSIGSAQLMGDMMNLTKVKIWYQSTADATSYLSNVTKAIKRFIQRDTDSVGNFSKLQEAIKGFIEKSTNKHNARSLSLNMNNLWSEKMLNFSLNTSSCYLSSLKLQGNSISSMPQFVTFLRGLTKLCLSFSHLQLNSDMIKALNGMIGLEYLKLIATQLDKIVIRRGELKGLRHICVAVEVRAEIEIQKGAMPDLESLRLLCKDLNGLSGTTILSLPGIKEVALHDEVSKETKDECEEAANNHPKHPKLLFVTKAIVDELFKPMRCQAAAGTATNRMLSVTTPSDAISTGQSVPVVTSEIGSEPAEEIISVVPTTTIDNTPLPVNHGAITNLQQENPGVTSDPGSEHDVESSSVAPASITTDNAPLPVNQDAISNAHQEYPVATFETGREIFTELHGHQLVIKI